MERGKKKGVGRAELRAEGQRIMPKKAKKTDYNYFYYIISVTAKDVFYQFTFLK